MPLGREVSDFTAIARSSFQRAIGADSPACDSPILSNASLHQAFIGRIQGNTFVVAGLITACVATMMGRGTPILSQRVFPALIENCAVSTTYARPPARAVALNQAATEVMLALGLQDRLVGTAYLDDEILPELSAVYQRIKAQGTPAEVLTVPLIEDVYGVKAEIGRHPSTGRPHVFVHGAEDASV